MLRNNTPRFRTTLNGSTVSFLMEKRFMWSGTFWRLMAEPQYMHSVFFAFSCSLFDLHQSLTVAAQFWSFVMTEVNSDGFEWAWDCIWYSRSYHYSKQTKALYYENVYVGLLWSGLRFIGLVENSLLLSTRCDLELLGFGAVFHCVQSDDCFSFCIWMNLSIYQLCSTFLCSQIILTYFWLTDCLEIEICSIESYIVFLNVSHRKVLISLNASKIYYLLISSMRKTFDWIYLWVILFWKTNWILNF